MIFMDDTEKLIYKYALLNAVKHKGNAKSGAVVCVIMGSHPELRKESKKIVNNLLSDTGLIFQNINEIDRSNSIGIANFYDFLEIILHSYGN